MGITITKNKNNNNKKQLPLLLLLILLLLLLLAVVEVSKQSEYIIRIFPQIIIGWIKTNGIFQPYLDIFLFLVRVYLHLAVFITKLKNRFSYHSRLMTSHFSPTHFGAICPRLSEIDPRIACRNKTITQSTARKSLFTFHCNRSSSKSILIKEILAEDHEKSK